MGPLNTWYRQEYNHQCQSEASSSQSTPGTILFTEAGHTGLDLLAEEGTGYDTEHDTDTHYEHNRARLRSIVGGPARAPMDS